MNVSEIMNKSVVTVPHTATLRDAAEILSTAGVSGAPVLDQEGTMIGIVSEKDIFKSLYPSHAEFYDSPGIWIDLDKLEEKTMESADKPVVDIMTREVVTVNPDASLMQVGSIMLVRGIHRVMVVGQSNEVIGVVARRDIYNNILKKRLNI